MGFLTYNESMSQRPPCLKCRHFFVTWDKSYPRGCRMFGIKTDRMPSERVFETTGVDCPAFQPQPAVQEKKPEEKHRGLHKDIIV